MEERYLRYKHLNEYLDVEVTSALQTEAGRMIFANIKKE